MSELNELRQVIETNFRLNALQTRELGATVNQRLTGMGETMDEMTQSMEAMSQSMGAMGQSMEGMGRTFQSTLDQNVERDEETLGAIRQILDNSVDLQKTTADHERRIRKLEQRAS